MPTSNLNLPYPGLGDIPDVPKDIKALADALDSILNKIDTAAANAFVQRGVHTGLNPATASGSEAYTTVTFPTAFKAGTTPVVLVSYGPTNQNFMFARTDQVSNAGFRLIVRREVGGGTATVSWMATGQIDGTTLLSLTTAVQTSGSGAGTQGSSLPVDPSKPLG